MAPEVDGRGGAAPSPRSDRRRAHAARPASVSLLSAASSGTAADSFNTSTPSFAKNATPSTATRLPSTALLGCFPSVTIAGMLGDSATPQRLFLPTLVAIAALALGCDGSEDGGEGGRGAASSSSGGTGVGGAGGVGGGGSGAGATGGGAPVARSIRGQLTWETGQVQNNGSTTNGIFTDGTHWQGIYENGSPRVITSMTRSSSPRARYTGAPLSEGDVLTFGDTGGYPEMRGRLFYVKNSTSTEFDVWQDGDDTGYDPGKTVDGDTRTNTLQYGSWGGDVLAQEWGMVATGQGNPTLPLDADFRVVQGPYSPPSNAIGPANPVAPLRGSHFLSTEIHYWKNHAVILGNSDMNKPRWSGSLGGGQEFNYGDEHWFSFSIFLPSNYHHESATDQGSRNQLLLVNDIGGTAATNALEIHLEGSGGAYDNYVLDQTHGGSGIVLASTEEDVDLWTTFVIRIKCHSSEGISEIWKSTGPYTVGKQRAMTKLHSRINQPVGPVVSQYQWWWRNYKFGWHHNSDTIESTVVWIGWDEIRYGEASGGTGFSDVHPFQHSEP